MRILRDCDGKKYLGFEYQACDYSSAIERHERFEADHGETKIFHDELVIKVREDVEAWCKELGLELTPEQMHSLSVLNLKMLITGAQMGDDGPWNCRMPHLDGYQDITDMPELW